MRISGNVNNQRLFFRVLNLSFHLKQIPRALIAAIALALAIFFTAYATAAQASDRSQGDLTFEAVYFDRTVKNPPKIREKVKDIAIKFGGRRVFPDIEPRNFTASWSGFVYYDEPVTKQILVSQSWAKTRIKIDGDIVYEGGSNTTIEHKFSAGKHHIEVFYINNWHTVEFKVTIQDKKRLFSRPELTSYFSAFQARPRNLVYIGLYESRARDTSVEVDLSFQHEGVTLWLDSYEAIDWRLENDPGVRAVVVAAFSPGSRVFGLRDDVPVLHTRKSFGIHSATASRCRCTAASFHCEDRTLIGELEDRLFELTGARIVAIGTSYSADKMRPQPFDKALRSAIEHDRAQARQAEAACKRRVNPDFDTLFSD
ncbi:hypothetical protein ABVF61_20055 [Roseibium sp. HPY-6]|uniref:hypothetical protein n=1 Tax=Roseibium sp. HPY-6 TaxID=3229852 RepID=UPI00338DA282